MLNLFNFKKKQSKKDKKGVLIGHGYPLKIGTNVIHFDPSTGAKKEDIIVNDKLRLSHWLTLGTTGAGKTRFLEIIVEHDILEGYSVAIFDPKPDRELFARVIWAAKKANRLKELIVVRTDQPQYSAKVNPLAFYHLPEELVQHVMAGIPPDTQEFFRNVAREVSTVVIMGKWLLHRYLGQKSPRFTIEDLRSHISREGLAKIYNQLQDINASGGFTSPDMQRYLDTIHTCMASLIDSPQEYFAKITSTLRTVLTSMVVGATGDILGKTEENLFLKRILNGERIILIVQAPAMTMRDSGFISMRTILSMFQALAGHIYLNNIACYQGKLDPPLFIHIDELSEALYWDFINFLNKSRGAGIGIHGLSQSIADFDAVVGKQQADRLLDNFNTLVFFRAKNPRTAKYISDLSGTTNRFTRVVSQGEFTTREIKEPLISTTEALELKDRFFFFFGKKGNAPVIYKGKTLFVENVPLKVDM